jgi:hypothetical protein
VIQPARSENADPMTPEKIRITNAKVIKRVRKDNM